jgi:serine/threonine-protein kinase
MMRSLETGKVKELFGGYIARYLNTGHIVYTAGNKLLETRGDLFAVPFDLNKLEATGGAVSLISDISGFLGVRYAISDSGTLVYIPGTTGDFVFIGAPVWVDFRGQEMPIEAKPNIYSYPKISPDGTKAAFAIRDFGSGNTDIWISDLLRKTLTRLTFHEGSSIRPLWTPDGKRIVYSSDRDGGNYSIYWKSADGTRKDEKLASIPDRSLYPGSLSREGKTLAMAVGEGSPDFPKKWDIRILSMEGEHAQKALLQQEYIETQPQISPDGQWIAYSSNESGQFEVYVRPFPEVDKGKWQVSTSGGDMPLWSPNGRELFYRNDDSAMAVAVENGQTFKCGKPGSLFQGKYLSSWDVSPDGKRFLMMKDVEPIGKPAADAPRRINIVLNWFEELKQRVPVK